MNYLSSDPDYIFYPYDEFKNKIQLGDYIKYQKPNGDINYGGIIVKIDNLDNKNKLMIYYKGFFYNKIFKCKYLRNKIYLKKHVTHNQKLKKIFISYL